MLARMAAQTAVGVQALHKVAAQGLEQRAPRNSCSNTRAVRAQQLREQRAPPHLATTQELVIKQRYWTVSYSDLRETSSWIRK